MNLGSLVTLSDFELAILQTVELSFNFPLPISGVALPFPPGFDETVPKPWPTERMKISTGSFKELLL